MAALLMVSRFGIGLPYVTGVLGAVFIALSAILVRLADVTPSTAAVFRCAYALPFLAAVALLERRRYGERRRRDRWLAAAAGVLFAADLTMWHHAIEAVGAGLATVLGNTQVVLVALLAWLLLGERPRREVLLAVPVVMVGVVLISGILDAGAYGANPPLGVVFGVSTGVAYAGFLLLLRSGNQDVRRPAGPLLDATSVALVAAAIAGLAVGDLNLAPSWPAHGWLALLALNSQVLGWLLISVSLPRLPAAVTSILLLLQPVGAVLLSMALIDERPSGGQLAGVAVVLAGIAIATIRRRPRLAPDAAAPSKEVAGLGQ